MLLGPALVMGGSAIGAGEWLTGPIVTAKYGGGLLWLSTLSILGQVVYNLEISRYTLYTGEPIFTGKFRTLPGGPRQQTDRAPPLRGELQAAGGREVEPRSIRNDSRDRPAPQRHIRCPEPLTRRGRPHEDRMLRLDRRFGAPRDVNKRHRVRPHPRPNPRKTTRPPTDAPHAHRNLREQRQRR